MKRSSFIFSTNTIIFPFPLLYLIEFVKRLLTHRSYIINLNKIAQIKNDGDTYLVYFRNYDQHAHVSKWKLQELQKKLQLKK